MYLKKIIISVFLIFLSLPLVQYVFYFIPETQLAGESLPIEKPIANFNNWFNGSLQKYFESLLDRDLGFRGYFIRTDNQMNYWLFGQIYQKSEAKIVVGKNHYLFEQNYIDTYTGEDYIDTDKLSKRVDMMKKIQDKLKLENKAFLLVIAPSKASFFSEYIPSNYLNHGDEKISKGYFLLIDELQKQGVNYYDGRKFFLENKNKTKAPLFTKSGTHWTIYGSCLATKEIMESISKQQNTIYNFSKCDHPNWSRDPLDQDADLMNLTNLWFKNSFKEKLAYPRIVSSQNTNKLDLLLVGDSFSWNILEHLKSGSYVNSYNFGYYFNTTHSFPDGKIFPTPNGGVELLDLIKSHNVVIIEINEASVSKMGWGFIEAANDVL